jgi:hypothetical protein
MSIEDWVPRIIYHPFPEADYCTIVAAIVEMN